MITRKVLEPDRYGMLHDGTVVHVEAHDVLTSTTQIAFFYITCDPHDLGLCYVTGIMQYACRKNAAQLTHAPDHRELTELRIVTTRLNDAVRHYKALCEGAHVHGTLTIPAGSWMRGTTA